MHFSLLFRIYFTLETKSEFGTTRAEKGVEDNFPNEHPILIKQNTKTFCNPYIKRAERERVNKFFEKGGFQKICSIMNIEIILLQ